MGNLGDRFPDFLRAPSVQRQLIPGVVIKLCEIMDDGEIHEKRFLVLRVDDNSVCCVINSQISAFIQAREALLRCQVAMPQASHPFMSHDSFVDCSRTRHFETSRVLRDLNAKTEWVLGRITSELRDEIVGALKYSVTLSVQEVASLCAELEAIQF